MTSHLTGLIAGESSGVGEPDQRLDIDRAANRDRESVDSSFPQLRHQRRGCVLEPSDRSALMQRQLTVTDLGSVSGERWSMVRSCSSLSTTTRVKFLTATICPWP